MSNLRVFGLYDSGRDYNENERLKELLQNNNNLFKMIGEDYIIYLKEDKEKVEKYLKIIISNDISFEDWLKKTGDATAFTVKAGNRKGWNIYRDDCIILFNNSIDKYIDRLWNSINFDEELEKLINGDD